MRQISRRKLGSKNTLYAFGALLLIVAVFVQYAQLVVRAAVTHSPGVMTAISANGTNTGNSHTCGIVAGAAYCWGMNNAGQLGNNSTTDSHIPVAVDTSGVLAGQTITAVSAGENHSCALAGGAVYCWGTNTYGQLGNNSTTTSLVPVAVSTSGVLSGKTITAIAAGDYFTCVLAASATYCWGANGSGQLGNNSTVDSHVPVAVSAIGSVSAISAGPSNACEIVAGAAYCWGSNTYGQLGNNSTVNSSVPVAVYTAASHKVSGKTVPASPLYGQTVTAISTGQTSTCAIAAGAAYCWGEDFYGELGDGGSTNSSVPVTVSTAGVLSGKTVTAISTGTSYTCVIASNAVYCWGSNSYGTLGNNSTTQSNIPVAVSTAGVLSGKTVTMVAASDDHTCAIADNAYCWGSNANGQLGNNSTTQSLVPVAVNSVLVAGTEPVSNAASGLFANANSLQPGSPLASPNQPATLHAGGDAFRLRTGIYNSLQATNNYNFTAISGGSDHSCALASGVVYCWGNDANGQLGFVPPGSSLIPVAVDTSGVLAGKTVTAIAAGTSYTCAIASGAPYCWGLDSSNQLGSNPTGYQYMTPVAVDTSGVLAGKTVTAISAGTSNTCAVASSAVYCWGDDTYGEAGNNSTGASTIPVAVDTSGVLAGKTVTAISAGQYYSCAIASGAAYCWGYNSLGQLGNNTTVDSHVPVAVDTSGVLAGKTVTAISAGTSHTCVIASGAAYCWGAQNFNELGNNSGTGSSVPVAVDTSGALAGKTITAVAAGTNHTCVIASSTAYCWGYDYYGQTGNTSATPAPVDASGVLAGKSITAITAGSDHTCAIGSNALYCWGYNASGQLGNNTTTDAHTPVAVNAPGAPAPNTASLRANDNSFSLQYAQKTAATCSAQTTGFTNVSTNTTMAWNTNSSVASGSVITANANDPTPAASTVYQTYVSGGTTFTNSQDIPVSENALWDFSLKDNSGLSNTSFCFKIVYANGTDLEQYTNFPEVTTASVGLNLNYVDSSGTPITLPTFSMTPTNLLNTCQTVTATLGSASGNRLRITQDGTTANGWNVSIAPTNGSTALWTSSDNSAFYDFNDPSGSPPGCNSGSDGDGYAGQLSFDTSKSIVTPETGCSTTGLSWNSGLAGYDASSIGAITLLTASSSSSPNCYWDISDTKATQTIPPQQPAGSYSLQLTATVVAQ